MEKYFIVVAKCGHVGKDMYIPMDFSVIAENRKEAAFIVRQMPGVKRDHPDAILSVSEVTLEEFVMAKLLSVNDPYWRNGKKKIGVKCNLNVLFSRLVLETRRETIKTNKMESRKFRHRRAIQYERSLRDDVAREFGVSV